MRERIKSPPDLRASLVLVVFGAGILALGLYGGAPSHLMPGHEVDARAAGTINVVRRPAPTPRGIMPRRLLPQERSGRLRIVAELALPDRIRLGRGVTITAAFNVAAIDPEGFMTENDAQNLLHQHLQAELFLAGAAVEPAGTIPLSRDLTAAWSVMPGEPANYEGFVRAETRDLPQFLDFDIEDRVDVTLRVLARRLSVNDGLSIAAAILGMAGSATGLVKVYWTYRDRRKSKDEDSDEA